MNSRWLVVLVALSACSAPRVDNAAHARAAGAATKPTADATVATVPVPELAGIDAGALADEPARCEDPKDVHLFVSPAVPWSGAPLRVVAVSDRPLTGELRLTLAAAKGAKGKAAPASLATTAAAAASDVRHGGPPYFWTVEVSAPAHGSYVAALVQRACAPAENVATRSVNVGAWGPGVPAAPKETEGLWPVRSAWSHHLESVYSAWIETLFDAPDGEMPSWPALQDVLRDRTRNLLFDHLGAGEDGANAPLVRPDCADLPYFLRAYFAFKLRLPFGLSECNRGGGGIPPSCKAGILTNEDPPAKWDPSTTAIKTFGTFLKGTLADKAHSGSARQPFEEPNSDYYPVPLTWESLRPGTTFADPYGHVLVVAKRLAQTAERGGVLLAVDGQPDGTVARKRYWRGNFLYTNAREFGGPGFKRFRPVSRHAGHLERWSDSLIQKSPEYGDVSREQAALDTEAFYDAMDGVLSPQPLDPGRALLETIAALEEQVRTRVNSVDNGRKWLETTRSHASMPDGAEIFETTGAWEDFSTPSRDLRILIASDVVRAFATRVARRPERYAMPAGRLPQDVAADLDKALARELAARAITYTRTDGTPFTLTLAEVLARSTALEVAYNPNDCVELRWGAPPGSDEGKACHATAPAEQRARMETYRAWLHERRRPPRK